MQPNPPVAIRDRVHSFAIRPVLRRLLTTRWQNPTLTLASTPPIRMGYCRPRSLAAEANDAANDCFMVRIPLGSDRIQGRSATPSRTKAGSPRFV